MIRLKHIPILCCITVCWGCNFDDYNQDLGNDYIFMFEGGGLNKIGKQTGRDSYSISYNLIIPPAVIDIDYNDEYILALHARDVSHTNSTVEYKFLRDTSNHQYWIIESKRDIIHGPLAKKEYQVLRTQLGIPSKLQVGDGELELLREW